MVTVGDADAIADVGVTLVELLEDRIDRLDRGDIALTTPGLHGERGNDWRLTLYLYDVSENDHLRGGERPVLTFSPFGAVDADPEGCRDGRHS